MTQKFETTTYSPPRVEILAIPDHYVSIGRLVEKQTDATLAYVTTVNSLLMVMEGSIYPANDKTAQGVVLSRYDVTDGDQQIAIVTHGTVQLSKCYQEPSAAAIAALRGITFVDDTGIMVPETASDAELLDVVGALASLNTTVKTDVVAALNEVLAGTAAHGTVLALTESGAIAATDEVITLDHIDTLIEATIATSVAYAGRLMVISNISASGVVAHTVTLTAGTWDGTETVLTLDAPGEFVVVYFDEAGDGTILVRNVAAGEVQALTASGALSADAEVITLDHTTVAIAATVADATVYAGKTVSFTAISEPGAGEDHTVVLTGGTFDGTNATATFADDADRLVVQFDAAGNGIVLLNTGSVALS